MYKDTTQIVKKLLASPQKIVIVGHKNPDGDAVGSCLGLSSFLKSLGHNTTVIMANDFPEFVKWLPGCEEIVIYEKEVQIRTAIFQTAYVVFTLDLNSLDRVGDLQILL